MLVTTSLLLAMQRINYFFFFRKRSGRITRKYIIRGSGMPSTRQPETDGGLILKSSAVLHVPPSWSIISFASWFSSDMPTILGIPNVLGKHYFFGIP